MSGTILSAGIRQNLLSLQNTASLMSTAQSRLSTGKKVNSALDNPSNFFTSSSLSSRANDLSAILDAMSNGIKTLEAASNGLSAITNTVQSMQATVNQARQDQSYQGTSYTIDTATIGTASAKNLSFSGGTVTGTVNVAANVAGTGGTASTLSTSAAYAAPTAARIASYTAAALYSAGVPAGPEVLQIDFTPSGGAAKSVAVTLDTTEGTIAEAVDKINAAILLDADTNGVIKAVNNAGKLEIQTLNNVDGAITVSGAGETNIFGAQVTQTGSDGLTAFTVNGTAVSVDVNTGANVDAAANSINLQLSAASSAFEAFNDSGKLGIREKSASGLALTIGGADSGLFTSTTNTGTAGTGGSVKTVDELVTAINANGSLSGKVKASNDGGKLRITNLSTSDLTVTGATSSTIDGSNSTQTIGGNTVRKNLITQFNDLRDQLNKLADDASFNGINLLHGDKLQIVFNETNTSSISIQSQNASGISVNTLSIGSATGTEFSSDTSLDTRLTGLRDALTSLRSQSSAFGSNLSVVQNRQDFTKSMINTLQTGADNLVLADANEEAANVLALQTRQQLSTTAMSLANQAAQGVLRLF